MGWDILGNTWAADLLKNNIARGEVRHAYLFCGPAGVGRRTLALRFARALNCLQPPEPGEACGECRICLQIERMQHADLSVVQSEGDSAAIKVEQIRDLQRSLTLLPYEARYRLALLLNFEQATASSQNALLKTLEEPATKVVLLLTADAPENLLPTVVSRCEVLRLRPMSVAVLAADLTRKVGLPPERAELLAHLAGGRPGSALRLRDDPQAFENRGLWLDELQAAFSAGHYQRFKLAERISRDKETMRQVLQTWLLYWRDVMLLSGQAHAPLTNLDRKEELQRLAAHLDYRTAHRQVSALEQAIAGLDANLNMRLLAEVLLLDIPQIGRA